MRTVLPGVVMSSFLPGRPHPATSLHDAAQLAHWGVANEDVQRLARRRLVQGPRKGGRAAGQYGRDVGTGAGVLEPQRDLLGPGSADGEARELRHQLLEFHIPEPGEVLAVDHGGSWRGQGV